jgi:hypothetical protein
MPLSSQSMITNPAISPPLIHLGNHKSSQDSYVFVCIGKTNLIKFDFLSSICYG